MSASLAGRLDSGEKQIAEARKKLKEPIPAMSSADAGAKRSRVSLAALKPLAPYAFRHRGRIALALVALVIASAATLAVPIAVRRMIDFGFSDTNADLIRAYFLGMIGIVAVLALASGARYYLVMTLGERV